jgi:hypothetical protein
VKRGVLAALSFVLTTGVLAGCSTPTTDQPSAAATSSRVAATPSPKRSAFTGDLETLLLPMPDGAQVWSVNDIHDDMPDVIKSATLWNASNAQKIVDLLKGNGYDRGAMRFWRDSAGNVVLIDLMQFRTANGMYDWLDWSADGLTNGNAAGSGHVREADSGKWVEFVDGDIHELVVVFGRAEFGVVMRVSSAGAANLDLLTSLAVEQYKRLPGTSP